MVEYYGLTAHPVNVTSTRNGQGPVPAIREMLTTPSQDERKVVRRICGRQIAEGRAGHEG